MPCSGLDLITNRSIGLSDDMQRTAVAKWFSPRLRLKPLTVVCFADAGMTPLSVCRSRV
jgi:hypothetical protein